MSYRTYLVFERPNIMTPFADPETAYDNPELNFDALINEGLLLDHSISLSLDGLKMIVNVDWVSIEKYKEHEKIMFDDTQERDWKTHWKKRLLDITRDPENWQAKHGVKIYVIVDEKKYDLVEKKLLD